MKKRGEKPLILKEPMGAMEKYHVTNTLLSSFNESLFVMSIACVSLRLFVYQNMESESNENEIINVSEKNSVNSNQDYEFISNDPKENADNFDPKWALLRDLTTDEERYEAIRKRWGNQNIPDPSVNLTFRQISDASNSLPENTTSALNVDNDVGCVRATVRNRSKDPKSRRRSRSCTRPYEDLICDLEKNYFTEYCHLMQRHKIELQEMLQFFSLQSLNAYFSCPQVVYDNGQNLQLHQKRQVFTLLSNQYQQIKNFLGEKTESLDACKRYLEEVKAFFTFYQKLNDSEVTLQMTDEQYEHTKETERMYLMYNHFYGKDIN